MTTSADLDQGERPTGALVAQWARAVCLAATARPEDVADALGVDLAAAETLGSQRICQPLDGATQLELVIGNDGETVAFIDIRPSRAVTVADLEAAFGEGRTAVPGPHERAPTVIFDDVWPVDAPRGCTVLARLNPAWPEQEAVATVVVYLQSERLERG